MVRASRPGALRAGSAVPRRSFSPEVAAAVSSAQLYVFDGHPSERAALGSMATPTGVAARLPVGVTGVLSLSEPASSSQRAESGTHTSYSPPLPARRASATW